jgi:hypothetical protein
VNDGHTQQRPYPVEQRIAGCVGSGRRFTHRARCNQHIQSREYLGKHCATTSSQRSRGVVPCRRYRQSGIDHRFHFGTQQIPMCQVFVRQRLGDLVHHDRDLCISQLREGRRQRHFADFGAGRLQTLLGIVEHRGISGPARFHS